MSAKEPVILTVLIETAELRWYVAGIGLTGDPIPLLRSEEGNLRPYIGVSFDEQTSFLRHRLSGVLQRGCDRLWGRQKKPCQIVFVADGPFIQAEQELTDRVAEHFVEWMTNPPVAFFTSHDGFARGGDLSLQRIAGEVDATNRTALDTGLPALLGAMTEPDLWELSPTKGKS